MGRLCDEPLSSIASSIVSLKSLSQFVETGTYKGYSLAWASEKFRSIYTIEIDINYYNIVRSNFRYDHINFLLGDSRTCLSLIDFSQPSLIWLDAHSGGGKFGDEDCPLLDELSIILNSDVDHYIMIDDARAFCWPLEEPYDYLKWPTLNDIFELVNTRYWICIKHDVIFLIPNKEQSIFQKLFTRRQTDVGLL